jgi:hypothetical protein
MRHCAAEEMQKQGMIRRPISDQGNAVVRGDAKPRRVRRFAGSNEHEAGRPEPDPSLDAVGACQT